MAEAKQPLIDPWRIIIHPLLTEKALSEIETQNKIVFIVNRKSNKNQIRWAVEKALEVKVDKIKTMIDTKGRKKAIIKLTKDFNVGEIATRFGML